MSTTNPSDDLRNDFIVSVSVLGSVCGVLICAVIVLFIWNLILHKKIKKLDPFVNFKLQRPKKIQNEYQEPVGLPVDDFKTVYDNASFHKNQERRDLNPIATRSKTSFDNGNFSFGNNRVPSNSSFGSHNKLSTNSFRNPDYLHLDNRFY